MEQLCAKRSLTGEPIEAALPQTASALSIGEVNFEHAAVIATTVASLPDLVRAERGSEIEATLTQQPVPRIRDHSSCWPIGSSRTWILTDRRPSKSIGASILDDGF